MQIEAGNTLKPQLKLIHIYGIITRKVLAMLA